MLKSDVTQWPSYTVFGVAILFGWKERPCDDRPTSEVDEVASELEACVRYCVGGKQKQSTLNNTQSAGAAGCESWL